MFLGGEMAGFKRARYLSCFYCGCKTSTRYDGKIKQFDCPKCEATNHLDENGDITDPPISATEAAAPRPVNYAIPRPGSPPSGPPDVVFCATCLKNQHLVAASLAQYFPDNPDAPDYADLEKNYYKFRRGLEKRYPQICADCEPKARRRIEQSAYTAKTDALRRMIERSQKNRSLRQRSPLDFCHSVGWWLRVAGLVLQMLWHLSALFTIASSTLGNIDDAPSIRQLLRSGGVVLGSLPEPSHLIKWSLLSALFGIWWNPRFVQTVRGFTKHLVGFSHWYLYQAMILSIRFASLKFSTAPGLLGNPKLASRIGSHLLIMAFTLTIYNLSSNSIRTDTTPLFGSGASSPPPVYRESADGSQEETNSLSQALDDIMQTTGRSPGSRGSKSASSTRNPYQFASANGTPNHHAGSSAQFQSLNISGGRHNNPTANSISPIQQGEEMDWTPTQSKHRAFSAFGTGQQAASRGFNQSPTEPQKGHFWYHVPPAPTTPAQRLFNPPNQPRLRKSPASNPSITFRGANDVADTLPRLSPTNESKQVTFAEPSFFAAPARDDPRDSLSDLFVDGFSLTPSQEEQRTQGSWVGNLMGFMYPNKSNANEQR